MITNPKCMLNVHTDLVQLMFILDCWLVETSPQFNFLFLRKKKERNKTLECQN